jgi:hypothetical protein
MTMSKIHTSMRHGFLIVALGLSAVAGASKYQWLQGTVKSATCSVVYVNYAKQSFNKTPVNFRVGERVNYARVHGQKVLSREFETSSSFILVAAKKDSQTLYYLSSEKCLIASNETKAPRAPTPAARSSFTMPTTPSRRSGHVGLMIQNIRTTSKVTLPDGRSTSLNVFIIGALPFGELRWQHEHFEWGLTLGLFVGQAEIGRSLSEKQTLDNFDYQADGVPVFGTEAAAFVLYRPSFKNVALGLRVPVRWSHSPWPIPSTGYQVEPQQSVRAMYLFETRLEREHVAWIQSIGLYQKWGDVLWSLGASYRF